LDAQAIKIVAADDDLTTFGVIEHALGEEGFDLTLAEDGLQAIEQITNNTEVLLLDICMPNMDGHECLRRVHAEFPLSPDHHDYGQLGD